MGSLAFSTIKHIPDIYTHMYTRAQKSTEICKNPSVTFSPIKREAHMYVEFRVLNVETGQNPRLQVVLIEIQPNA
jgi:hypothetical protein